MNRKAKGIAGERELIHAFWKAGWAAFRCAASGAIKYPVPDIIAGNNLRKMAIEVKTVSGDYKYFSKKEIADLQAFADRFGSEAWVAIKFMRRGWFFLSVEDLELTRNNYTASIALCQRRGFGIDEVLDISESKSAL